MKSFDLKPDREQHAIRHLRVMVTCLLVGMVLITACDKRAAGGDLQTNNSAETLDEFESRRAIWKGGAEGSVCLEHTRFPVESLLEYSDLIGLFEVTEIRVADLPMLLEVNGNPYVDDCDGVASYGVDIVVRPIQARIRDGLLAENRFAAAQDALTIRLTALELEFAWESMVVLDEQGDPQWVGGGAILEGEQVYLSAVYSEEERVFSTTGHPIVFEYDGEVFAPEGREIARLGCLELEWPVLSQVDELMDSERAAFEQRTRAVRDPDTNQYNLGRFRGSQTEEGQSLYALRQDEMNGPFFRRAARCYPYLGDER